MVSSPTPKKSFEAIMGQFSPDQIASDEGKVCLPGLENICGLNIAWVVLVTCFIWFSTMGGLSAVLSSNQSERAEDDKEEKKGDKKEGDKKDDDKKDDKKDGKKDDKKKKPKKKEGTQTPSGGGMYVTLLAVVCICMVLLGGYQIMGGNESPYGAPAGGAMPDKYSNVRVYEEDDGTDGLHDKSEAPTPKAAKKKKKNKEGAKRKGRLEFTFTLEGFGDGKQTQRTIPHFGCIAPRFLTRLSFAPYAPHS
jgi:hypothetical protein